MLYIAKNPYFLLNPLNSGVRKCFDFLIFTFTPPPQTNI